MFTKKKLWDTVDNSPMACHSYSHAKPQGPAVTTWTSDPIELSDDLLMDVQASAEGVVIRKSVEGVYASDVLMTPEQAEQYGKALIEASAHSRAMKGE